MYSYEQSIISLLPKRSSSHTCTLLTVGLGITYRKIFPKSSQTQCSWNLRRSCFLPCLSIERFLLLFSILHQRYAGLAWTSPDQTFGVIDVKGIEGATRRDSVPIIARIMSEIMELLFPLHKNNAGSNIITEDERRQTIDDVQKVVKISVRKILGGELDVGEFIMTRVIASVSLLIPGIMAWHDSRRL